MSKTLESENSNIKLKLNSKSKRKANKLARYHQSENKSITSATNWQLQNGQLK